ncbi:MAG: UDP-N-acetylmuramate--L-alanine ligase [Gemmatimonadetes bacterium]|nr:UDP-N-acetylmuramate--L-alanine ligase [Gemmatimonadota bacterium]
MDDTMKDVHFVGIGGVRLSALAEMLVRGGSTVSGSDRASSVFTERLETIGVSIRIGHDADHIGKADTVVFTPAVEPDNPELVAARDRGIRIVEGKKLLGEMTHGKRLVAVSGTHGKTTTTAMISSICETAGLDPTAFVGGAVQGPESNLRVGDSDVWVVEADEYDRAFLELSPTVAVVTSLESDHLDLYDSESNLVETFDAFLSGLTEDGSAVISSDYPASRSLTVPAGRARVDVGFGEEAVLTAEEMVSEGLKTSFTVVEGGETVGDASLQVPGRHNVANALSAIGAARRMDIDWSHIARGLERFRGVRRRFEIVGSGNDITVVNDYAHHPTEIDVTIEAGRAITDGRIVAVFQPHLYSRTRDFLGEFQTALSRADVCWLTGIYPARETPIPGITGRSIADGIDGCHYEEELNALAGSVMNTLEPGDLVLVMGAGSIERTAVDIAKSLSGGAGEQESGGTTPTAPTVS